MVGWSMIGHRRTELTLAALALALGHRDGSGVLHHTDRRAKSVIRRCRAYLQEHRLVQGMPGRAEHWHNGVGESCSSVPKIELVYRGAWRA